MEDIGTLLAGKWEVAIGKTLIPASLLGDIKPSYSDGTLEAKTQAGVRKQPSGKAETAELSMTIYLPSMDALKALWGAAYSKPTNSKQKTGNIVFGKGSVVNTEPLAVNIHRQGEKTDDNDIHIFAAIIPMKFDPTLSTDEPLQVEAVLQMQPTEHGYMRIGTGDLAKPSRWDYETQRTVEVSES